MKNSYFDIFSMLKIFDMFGKDYEEIADTNEHGLQLARITLDENYAKEWNERLTDFVCLTKNGELLRPTLYRVGGMGTNKIKGKRYFMLLKHVEAYYSEDILKMSGNKDPKHLESRWCIIDEFGNEKVECKQFASPYLVKDSCIYSIESSYYNIETGELYCHTSESIESRDFLFLENRWDKDEKKRGVMKINKKDGTWELFPE